MTSRDTSILRVSICWRFMMSTQFCSMASVMGAR
jgi:hypothetical protein